MATNGVRAALAAGWVPATRGKPETYMVDANGCDRAEAAVERHRVTRGRWAPQSRSFRVGSAIR